jgi:hypothetical protein
MSNCYEKFICGTAALGGSLKEQAKPPALHYAISTAKGPRDLAVLRIHTPLMSKIEFY